ncbi:glycoside hydrolase family 37 protein, partial [Fistulina hepatica ATCC 64428]
ISTSVPSPTASLGASLPSQVALPPAQAWCPSQIFCAGALLQTVNVADIYSDPKTFVDKPTDKSATEVLNDFANVTNGTIGEIVTFVDEDFLGEGLELEGVALDDFNESPPFLNNVSDTLVRAFAQKVHTFWTQLVRASNSSAICGEGLTCASSFIPLNHTFIIPGGRFREQYYWDSLWITEGLIQSELYDLVNSTLQNFMDELDKYGFIPNGGRIYYLDRSQPPVFIQMLSLYVNATNDTSIFERALPLAEKELNWWKTNRSIEVTSPSGNTHTMYHYAVNNSAPRPESYLTDYDTANFGTNKLNETQRSALYSELASGAETGWDFTVRWTGGSGSSNLQDLETKNTIPVCLNSLLYRDHVLLAGMYASSNESAAEYYLDAAEELRAGILDLFWNSSKLAFYDFNILTGAQSTIFTAATFYPVWSGIVPSELLASADNAFGYFASLNLVLTRYNGTYPSSFIYSGLQWDAPNTWPPHLYIALKALQVLPDNVTSGALPTPSGNASTFSLVPTGQLDLTETQLPGQPLKDGGNSSRTGAEADINLLNGTVINGGNATDGEGWASTLRRELANRYMTSALCSWHATGGSISGILPRLSDAELNVTNSINNTGNMFEKFSINDVDSSGSGGEYTVQAGFGWTNGVVLWVASNYGEILATPSCPPLLVNTSSDTGSGNGTGSSTG